ncbi:hypothetical protein FQR65_LT04868 [Abscondita terminalis]|nr:hypothetical protein FQR65_LT04868 [Abscondita terminalis]
MISVCTYNHLNACVPIISSMFLGSKVSGFHPTQSLSDMIHCFKITKPKVVFVGVESVKQFEKVISNVDALTTLIVFGETDVHTSFLSVIQPCDEEFSFQPVTARNIKDEVVIFFSSGTSGYPKGICHTHFSLLSAPPTFFRIGPSSVFLNIEVPYWNVYLFILYFTVSNGITQMIYPKFYEDDPWKVFGRKVDTVVLITTNAVTVANTPKPDSVDVSTIRTFITGGSPLTINQIAQIKATFPLTLISVNYGQSEVFQTVACFDLENSKHVSLLNSKPTSCGLPKPGISYKIIDLETGKALGPNAPGEILLKTNSQLSGYYNQKSDYIWDQNGWLHTGDCGYYDDDFCFFIIDRVKEMFKYRYWHIVPAVIENILLRHQDVKKAVVVGVPHEVDDHHAMAFVQLKDGAVASEDEIVKFVEDRVEDRQRLRGGVKFLNTFPLTPSNKINRSKLKQMAIDEFV